MVPTTPDASVEKNYDTISLPTYEDQKKLMQSSKEMPKVSNGRLRRNEEDSTI